MNSLHLAAQSGDVSQVKQLLESKQFDVDVFDGVVRFVCSWFDGYFVFFHLFHSVIHNLIFFFWLEFVLCPESGQHNFNFQTFQFISSTIDRISLIFEIKTILLKNNVLRSGTQLFEYFQNQMKLWDFIRICLIHENLWHHFVDPTSICCQQWLCDCLWDSLTLWGRSESYGCTKMNFWSFLIWFLIY
jgi:hypothetical protein